MNITLRQLRVFQAVARERNFSRAGEAVALSQPAVSQAIGELETRVGLKLLDRTTREVALTEAGRTLAARLDRILEDLDQALEDVAGIASARGGTVRVGSSPTLSANLMPDCIAACALESPDLRVVLLDRLQEDVLGSVRAGDVDFGVVVEPAFTDDLDFEAVQDDPFVLVVPSDHPFARRRSVNWSMLDGASLVLLDQSSGSRRLIDRALEAHGARYEVKQQLGHPTSVFRMVERGIGISVMPGLAAPLYGSDRVSIRPLVPRVERTIMLVRRKNRSLSPAAAVVWDLVRRVAATADRVDHAARRTPVRR